MSDPRLKVTTSSNKTKVKKVVVGKPIRRVTTAIGNINDLGGLDLSDRANGSLLIYNINTGKWVARKDIEDGQTLNGGNF